MDNLTGYESIKQVPCKHMIAKVKSTNWFDISYNMNIYRGCTHACIYCDSRSDCYQDKDFDNIKVKANALEVIEADLKRFKIKGIIATGSMSDPYNPLEEKLMLTGQALRLIDKYRFGVSVITKSTLITRDIDVLQSISKHSPVIAKITITTANDELCKKIERNVAVSSERFLAIKTLAKNNIFCGIMLMPILPFINDTTSNICDIVTYAADNGAKFVYPSFGVTLRDSQREYFYDRLDEDFQLIKQKYQQTFAGNYSCGSPKAKELYHAFAQSCEKHNIMYKMQDIIAYSKTKYTPTKQLSLFD